MNRIEISHLNKTYPMGKSEKKTVFSDFSLTLTESTALMAPSGRGKTTLLRLICGLERPDAGSIRFASPPRISVVFQEDRLFPSMTAAENVLAVRRGRPSPGERKEAAELLCALGLTEEETEQPVRNFSGGMKRRTAIARALFFSHDILILDEPLKGLDDLAKSRTASVIRERSNDTLVLLVTHEREDAALCGITQIAEI